MARRGEPFIECLKMHLRKDYLISLDALHADVQTNVNMRLQTAMEPKIDHKANWETRKR